jgi:UDP-N-acetylglucosamine:LPS N-acetylglucosamine transferase
MKKIEQANVVFAGGGSGGSVAPLFAVAQELVRTRAVSTALIGTSTGPESAIAAKYNMPFYALTSARL